MTLLSDSDFSAKPTRAEDGGSFRSPALTVAIVTAATYLFFSCYLAVLAFKNFSVLSVLSTVLVLAVPVVIALLKDTRNGKRFLGKIGLKGFVTSFGVAGTLILIQSSSIRSGHSFFTNFPNGRIEAGQGFNIDSAFHVSIIQSILARGYPSTSQHLEPFLYYHTLSHYGDALVLFATGLDAWESYALLFFAKSAAIVLATLYFSYRVTRDGRENLFWVVAPLVALTFSNSWGIVISHANWLPMYLLLIASPWMHSVLRKPRIGIWDVIFLTAIVVTTGLGKISVGFSVAIFVGLVLFLREPRRPLIMVMGAGWAGFFFIWAGGFGGPSLISNWADAFREIGEEAFSLVGIALVFLFAYMIGRARNHLIFSLAIVASMAINAIVGLVFLRSPLDTAAFFLGLFAVVFLISTQNLLSLGIWEKRSPREGDMAKMPAALVALALTLASMPTLAKAPLSPFNPPMAVVDSFFLTNTVSYQWFNYSRTPPHQMSILRAATGSELPLDPVIQEPYFSVFERSLAEFLAEDSIASSDALLFLPSEQFEELSARSYLPNSEDLGLLLVAVTGVSLVHGMPDLDQDWKGSFFGNSLYGDDSPRLPEASVTEAVLCQWNRPVIRVEDFEGPSFTLVCAADKS